MNNSPFNPERFFKSACRSEAALILVAVVLGWLSGINPFADLHLTESAILYGILGTIPLFLLFLLLEHLSADSVVTIRRFLLETLAPALHRYHWADLFIRSYRGNIGRNFVSRRNSTVDGIILGRYCRAYRQQYCLWSSACHHPALYRSGNLGRYLFGTCPGYWWRQEFDDPDHYPRAV